VHFNEQTFGGMLSDPKRLATIDFSDALLKRIMITMKQQAIHGGGGREPPLREPYRHIWSVVRIFDYLLDSTSLQRPGNRFETEQPAASDLLKTTIHILRMWNNVRGTTRIEVSFTTKGQALLHLRTFPVTARSLSVLAFLKRLWWTWDL